MWSFLPNDTKERIPEAALEMFSQNGYTRTNIRELSASPGLVKSGVYKRYESKEAIWNALLSNAGFLIHEHMDAGKTTNAFLKESGMTAPAGVGYWLAVRKG